MNSSSVAGFRNLVRTLAQQEKARESLENEVDSGKKCGESLTKYDHVSHLWKTAQCSLFEESTEFSETWPKWGIMLDGAVSELRPPVNLAYLEKEFGSWPSVTKSMSNDYKFRVESMLKTDFGATQHRLTYQMLTHHGLWPTATLCERLMMWPEQWTELKELETGKFQAWLDLHGKH